MSWLVTGGAGYIGSHVVRAFIEQGITPIVVDDLSSGHREFVPDGVDFVEGQVQDTSLLERTMREHDVEGVMHIAGYKYAGVSVARPLHTYSQNVQGTAAVLEAMQRVGVSRIVFSSSAAVYGTPDVDLVTEDQPTAPESPYGQSKLIGEWLLADQARALELTDGATPLQHVSLRYFNVVGSGTDEVYDTSPHNLFPLVIEALIEGRTPRINGTDYPTPDGTCVRDYVHVADLATSHVAAAAGVQPGQRRRALGARDHGRDAAWHRPHLRAGDRRAPPRRPGAHRCQRGRRRPRPGLADAPLHRRHGHLGVAGAHRPSRHKRVRPADHGTCLIGTRHASPHPRCRPPEPAPS